MFRQVAAWRFTARLQHSTAPDVARLNQEKLKMCYQIGTPLYHSGNPGFICEVKDAPANMSVIGANGLEPIKHNFLCVWLKDDQAHHTSELSANIAESFIEQARRMDLDPCTDTDQLAEWRYQASKRQNCEREKLIEAREKASRDRQDFIGEAAQIMPNWAQGVIVGELKQDESDSMTDYYGSRVTKTVILGFSKHTRDLFPEMRKFARNCEETAYLADLDKTGENREKYSMGGGYYLKENGRHQSGWLVRKYRIRNGASDIPTGEWFLDTPRVTKNCDQGAQKTANSSIEQHTHTKKGFEMWLVIPADRVERDEFNALRDAARNMGGWYSRKWSTTPGGFAFKDQEQAEQFQNEQFGGDIAAPGPDTPRAAPKASPGTADRLRTMADKLQATIDDKERPRQENTPKRQREAGHRRQECARLKRTQDAMNALAAHHEAGTVPTELAKVSTKKAIYELAASGHVNSGGYYDAGRDTGEPYHDTPAAHALWALLKPKTPEELQAEKLRAMTEKLSFAKIPGYFPTPPELIIKMLDHARIDRGDKVLEPSAGSGAIADMVLTCSPDANLTCFEKHFSLREILEAKGHHLAGSDFLECEWFNHFDRVVMNPPFEKGQDMEHVRHAFRTLKPGGRLVSIMSPAFTFHQSAIARDFRVWFRDRGGEQYALEPGTFKESGTGVASVLVVIDKP